MPYFISPLSSQLTAKHTFFTQFRSLCLICPFSVCRHVPPSLSFECYLSLSSLTSPFCRICHGNVKKSQLLHFILCSFSRERRVIQFFFSFSWLLFVCCGLKVMKTIFHLHWVIWLGVAEQVCYGKINIMEGLTLLSLSGRDQCVCYWTGYITQTHWHACRLRSFKARMYTVCKHAHA